MGSDTNDEDLLSVASNAAGDARRLARELAGHPLWAAQADAADARVALARGDNEAAVAFGRSALAARQAAMRDDPHLEILLPAARVILASGDDQEKQDTMVELSMIQGLGAQRIMDERTRVVWFQTRVGRELAELAGPLHLQKRDAAPERGLDAARQRRAPVAGARPNESRDRRGAGARRRQACRSMLNALYARIGTTSRAETTALAFRTV